MEIQRFYINSIPEISTYCKNVTFILRSVTYKEKIVNNFYFVPLCRPNPLP